VPTLPQQVGLYLAGHTPAADDLFVLLGGANDFFFSLGQQDPIQSATVARWWQPHGYFGKGPRECTGRSRSRVTNHVTFRAQLLGRSCPKVLRCASRHNRRVAQAPRATPGSTGSIGPQSMDPEIARVGLFRGETASAKDSVRSGAAAARRDPDPNPATPAGSSSPASRPLART